MGIEIARPFETLIAMFVNLPVLIFLLVKIKLPVPAQSLSDWHEPSAWECGDGLAIDKPQLAVYGMVKARATVILRRAGNEGGDIIIVVLHFHDVEIGECRRNGECRSEEQLRNFHSWSGLNKVWVSDSARGSSESRSLRTKMWSLMKWRSAAVRGDSRESKGKLLSRKFGDARYWS